MIGKKGDVHQKENMGLGVLNKQVKDPYPKSLKENLPPGIDYVKPDSLASIESVENKKKIHEQITASLEFLLDTGARCPISKYYMKKHLVINEKMRGILIDWMVDISQKFKLRPASIHIAVSILDRYLSKMDIERSQLQLVGIAAMMIVGKYEEIYPPLLKDYVSLCDNSYTEAEILAMESNVLLCINFDLALPNAYDFLQFYGAFIELDERANVFCHYLLESCLLDMNYLDFLPHELAAGALLLVGKLFKRKHWSAFEEKLTRTSNSRAKAIGKEIYLIMQRIDETDLVAVKCKYSSPKYFEVSKFKIEKTSPDQH